MHQLGKRYEVLVEKEARRGGDFVQARTRDFKTVLVPGDASDAGRSTSPSSSRGRPARRSPGRSCAERQPLPMAV